MAVINLLMGAGLLLWTSVVAYAAYRLGRWVESCRHR